jgi:hypothetical protein
MLEIIANRILELNLSQKSHKEIVDILNTTDHSYYKVVPIRNFEILVTSLGCKGLVPDYLWELDQLDFKIEQIRKDLQNNLSENDYQAVLSSATAYENWAKYFLGRNIIIEDLN